MAKNYRLQITGGEHEGMIVDGVGCNARPYPNCPESEVSYEKYHDGWWIESLQVRLPKGYARDLVVPFDRYNKEIFVGDILHASVAKEVKMVKVLKLGDTYHVGCGWVERQLKCEDMDTGKKLTINIPAYTIKVS